MQVALAWLLHHSPNILLIPGTSSVAHLRENLAAGQLTLSPQTLTPKRWLRRLSRLELIFPKHSPSNSDA